MVPKAGDQVVASIEGDINIIEQIKIKDASTFKLRTKKSPLMLESGMQSRGESRAQKQKFDAFIQVSPILLFLYAFIFQGASLITQQEKIMTASPQKEKKIKHKFNQSEMGSTKNLITDKDTTFLVNGLALGSKNLSSVGADYAALTSGSTQGMSRTIKNFNKHVRK